MAVIMSNPDQSKHLETARMKVDGVRAGSGSCVENPGFSAASATWSGRGRCPAGADCVSTISHRSASWPSQVRGIWIDLVNLRSEEYAQHSRIPTMTVSGGLEGLGSGPDHSWRVSVRRCTPQWCCRRTLRPGPELQPLPTCPTSYLPACLSRSLVGLRRTRTAATSPSTQCFTTSTPGLSRTSPRGKPAAAAAAWPCHAPWPPFTRRGNRLVCW